MKNKYWILILIGMIILGIIAGIILYNFSFEDGYSKGYISAREDCVDEFNEKLSNCADGCRNWVGNIKGQCFDTCIWHITHDIGFAKIG